ncbi:MAG: PadR family transcriptional regulator [Candidatus Dormibacteria bacterium]|jgi:DNA-binding PadR family transcriptional regulator
MTRERTHHSRHQEPADSLREAAGRFHHHVRERLERGGRDRHRGGWSPFDDPRLAGDPRFAGFGGPGGFGGHGRRAARGDVRAAILVLLAEKQSHGYQIIQELERRSEGAWRASPGSVYPTLQQLEDEGLVRAVEADGGRRVFELTDTGKEEAAKLAAGPAPWADAAGSVGGDHRDLREQVFQLLAATAQVGRSGDAAHIAEARKILHEARRKLYLLLAGNESPSEKTEG